MFVWYCNHLIALQALNLLGLLSELLENMTKHNGVMMKVCLTFVVKLSE